MKRADKLSGAIQAELAQLISREVKDPRLPKGLITVIAVRLTPDLRRADVGVSLVGGGSPEEAVVVLTRLAGYLRGEVARRLNLRRAPELHFAIDRQAEAEANIERLLRDEDDQ